MFLIFKQHYTHFYILFHPHVFSKNTNNVTKTTLPNGPKLWNTLQYNNYTSLSFSLMYNYCYLDQVSYYKYHTINKNTATVTT